MPEPTLRPIQLPRQAYPLDSGPESAQDLVNLYAEIEPKDAKEQVILRSTPGATLFQQFGTGPVSAMADLHGFLYIVSGAEAFRVVAGGTAQDLGAVQPAGTIPATIAVGPNQVVICTPPYAYVATHAGTLTQITGQDLPAFSSVAYLNDRFYFTASGTGMFYASHLLDAATIDPLDFASQEAMPDVVVRGVSHGGVYWLFGADAIEVWQDVGAVDFPLRRVSGAVIYGGTTAAGSIARLDSSLCWLGRDNIVYRSDGFSAKRISTHAMEQAMLAYGDTQATQGCSYTQEGHQFYALTFLNAPSGGVTWVYDEATGLWHRRASGTGIAGRWRAQTAAQFGQSVVIGDSASGSVWFLAPNLATDAGATLARLAVFPPISADRHRVFMSRLEIDMEVGTALTPAALTLDWSDDGGITYGTPRVLQTGAVGARKTRPFATRLGSFRQRALRLNIVGYATIYGADAIMEGGAA